MGRFGRAFLKLLIYGSFVAVVVVVLSYWLITNSLPKTSGSSTLSMLDRPVHVYRDELGVPHLLAENQADLFRAMGFVMAQDRLWQMDFYRRAASGTLSEIFGSRTLEQDKLLRLWGFRRIARQIVGTLSEESRLVLQAYADGVNAFIEANNSRLPVEFSLLEYKPQPWKIEDSISFTRLLAWQLSFSWYVEIALNELVAKVGPEKAKEVFPDYPLNAPLIVPDRILPLSSENRRFLEANIDLRNFLGFNGTSVGSNAWVVSGKKTACGKPMLASDPHLPLMVPSIWYQVHLSSPEIDAAGVALPGVPGLVMGHNKQMAWGATNGMIDDVDFYIERVKFDSTSRYWDGLNWLNFEPLEELIHVKDSTAVQMKIRSTRNGPVISDLHPLLKNKSAVVSMRWVGQEPSDELAANLAMLKAKDASEFIAALREFKVPAQNFVFASSKDEIGYHLAGSIPVRKNANGILPHNGWGAGQWIGEIPFEKLPQRLNPQQGFIATANNKIIDDGYPYYLSNLWEPPGRIMRITQQLAAQDVFSVDDFSKLQMDVQSLFTQMLLPTILEIAQTRIDSSGKQFQFMYHLLKDWDGSEAEDLIAPSVFHAFFVKLTENTLKDEMGDELFRFYVQARNVPFRVMSQLMKADDSIWFDDIRTVQREHMPDMVIKSLSDAGKLLTEIAGEDVSGWRWGEIHALTMQHALGVVSPLDYLFNIGPIQRGGSTMTVNNSEYRLEAPFKSVVGSSMRQIVDLCDRSHSLSVISAGASGQRMSEHYSDQAPLWAEGKYHRLVVDWVELEQNAPEHLVLEPAD